MILVTGATGFVGRSLVPLLREGGQGLRLFVRNESRARALFGDTVEYAVGDITDRVSVKRAVSGGVDTVVHLVGVLSETKDASFALMHIEGTRHVVDACIENGVERYLHMSALGTRIDARSLYHKTKSEAEIVVRNSGLKYTIFRPSVIFGREDKFTNLFADYIRHAPFFVVPGRGENFMQPVFVGDVTRLIAHCVTDVTTINKLYEVGGPERFTFDRILDLVGEAIGRKVAKLHVPITMMMPVAALAEKFLPAAPITRDQLLMLGEDNVTDQEAIKEVLGVEPTGFVEGMSRYLS